MCGNNKRGAIISETLGGEEGEGGTDGSQMLGLDQLLQDQTSIKTNHANTPTP